MNDNIKKTLSKLFISNSHVLKYTFDDNNITNNNKPLHNDNNKK